MKNMGICDMCLILSCLFMLNFHISSSNKSIRLRPESPRSLNMKHSYADLLNSLIKVNEERVSTLKKLYVLNTYNKDVLRSNIEHKLDDYDQMQATLMRTLKYVLDSLQPAVPRAKFDDYLLYENRHHSRDFFLSPNIDEDKQKGNKSKYNYFLRNDDSDDNNGEKNEKTDGDDKSDARDSSKSSSLEKLDEESKEVKRNGTENRTVYVYGCGRGRVRCINACRSAYRYACDVYYCRSGLRRALRSACKSDCRTWFY